MCRLASRIVLRLRRRSKIPQLKQTSVHDHAALVAGVFAARRWRIKFVHEEQASTRIFHGYRESPRSNAAMHPTALDIVGAHDVAGPATIVAFEIVAVLLDLEPDLDRCHGIGAE
jgi:hypothetical protein